jgi:outer membrane protein FlgP
MKRLATTLMLTGLTVLTGCQSLVSADAPKLADAPPPAVAPTMIAPMVEKRETFMATGYAVISVQNHKNPAQQRLLAIRASKLDAYRSLTEQVYGQQLDANTTVADMTVLNDTFRTRVEGVIYGANLVSITPVGEDTYETTLSLDRAVVQDLRSLYLSQLASRRR